MKKLTKAQVKQKEELSKELSDAYGELEANHAKLKEAIALAWADFEVTKDAYTSKLEEARSFCEEIANEAQAAFDEKSEKWQEGEAASAISDWISEWQDVDFEDCEVDEPTLDDLPCDAGETIDSLNNEANS